MATQGASFKLGVFVVGGVLAGLITIVALGAGAFLKAKQPLYCYFKQSVKGLETDSSVTYRGVKVGRVVRVVPQRVGTPGERAGNALIRVECEVDPELLGVVDVGLFSSQSAVQELVQKLVDEGLRVQLSWGDLIGSKYLELDFLTGDDTAPPKLGFAPMNPYVPTYAPPSLADMQRSLSDTLKSISQVEYEKISKHLVDLLARLDEKAADADVKGISERTNATLDAAKALLDDGSLKRSVTRLDTITADLVVASAKLRAMAENEGTQTALDDAAASLASLRRLTADLEKRLPATLGSVDKLVGTVDATLKASRLPETTAAIRRVAEDAGGVSRDVGALRAEVTSALRDLAAAGRAVSRLARALEERPNALIRGKRPEEEDPR